MIGGALAITVRPILRVLSCCPWSARLGIEGHSAGFLRGLMQHAGVGGFAGSFASAPLRGRAAINPVNFPGLGGLMVAHDLQPPARSYIAASVEGDKHLAVQASTHSAAVNARHGHDELRGVWISVGLAAQTFAAQGSLGKNSTDALALAVVFGHGSTLPLARCAAVPHLLGGLVGLGIAGLHAPICGERPQVRLSRRDAAVFGSGGRLAWCIEGLRACRPYCRVRDTIRDAPKSSLHTISNSRRQDIGPFIHRLVADSDSLGGGGDSASEEFNGLRFKHDELNHSSPPSATIVLRKQGIFKTMVEETYAERLTLAMERAKVDAHALAKELHLTYTGMKKAMRGGDKGTSEMYARNNSLAARYLGVDPDWLATGEGSMYATTRNATSLPPDILEMAKDLAAIEDVDARELILVSARAAIERALEHQGSVSSTDTKPRPARRP